MSPSFDPEKFPFQPPTPSAETSSDKIKPADFTQRLALFKKWRTEQPVLYKAQIAGMKKIARGGYDYDIMAVYPNYKKQDFCDLLVALEEQY